MRLSRDGAGADAGGGNSGVRLLRRVARRRTPAVLPRLSREGVPMTTSEGREQSPVDAPEQHDERCEADFITGPMAYSPCGCAERAGGREQATPGTPED